MQASSTPQGGRLAWHGWLLAGVFLLYSLAAAIDYMLSLFQGAQYYRASGMTDAQVDYFSSLPLWVMGAWTCSVWAGVLAPMALLLRRRYSRALFALALCGTGLYSLYTLVLSAGREAMGDMWFMPPLIAALTAGSVVYCHRLIKCQVLV
ncbi:MAG: hypothetical protein U1F46_13010 [Marinagarivorans sp.]